MTNETVMARIYGSFSQHQTSAGMRIVLIIALAILVHVLVQVIRRISEWIVQKIQTQENPLGFMTHQPKFITLLRLIANVVTSIIYFLAMGMVLQEFGVDLTTYLESASIVGLAISFGSQGLVQDMVIGLTLIFSDAMDVGDMVEIAGAVVVIGRVEEIGLRFTKLVNLYSQVVFIPNRTIANVSRFPHGGVYAYADVQIPKGADPEKAVQTVGNIARGMWRQFGAIILGEPVMNKIEMAEDGGWNFVRVRFKIWPGQGSLIETTFRQQTISAMKTFDPNYADWQAPVTYRTMAAPQKM